MHAHLFRSGARWESNRAPQIRQACIGTSQGKSIAHVLYSHVRVRPISWRQSLPRARGFEPFYRPTPECSRMGHNGATRPNNARCDSVTGGAHVLDKHIWGKHEWAAIQGTPTVKQKAAHGFGLTHPCRCGALRRRKGIGFGCTPPPPPEGHRPSACRLMGSWSPRPAGPCLVPKTVWLAGSGASVPGPTTAFSCH